MKSEEGNKATFSHWIRLNTLFATEAWISLRRLLEAKASLWFRRVENRSRGEPLTDMFEYLWMQ